MSNNDARSKRPANLAPLNLAAYQGDASQPTPRSGAAQTRPAQVTLVVGGSAGVVAVDALAKKLKESGKFGTTSGTKLRGIVYEASHGEGPGTTHNVTVSLGAENYTPITIVTPLSSAATAANAAPPALPDAAAKPRHMATSYALPAFASAAALKAHAEAWLALLDEASKRESTLDLALAASAAKGGKEAEELREAVEELLGKAWDREHERAKQEGWEDNINNKGVRLVFDAFGGPPLNNDSSSMADWNGFIRRLALHPRVYLKLSPLSLAGLTGGGAYQRAVDVSVPGPSVVSSAAHTLVEGASAAVNAVTSAVAASTLSSTTSNSTDTPASLEERTRVLLDAAVEAFGEERIVWAAHLTAATADKQTVQADKISEPEAWYEIVRLALANMGLAQESLDNIFANNASKLYQF